MAPSPLRRLGVTTAEKQWWESSEETLGGEAVNKGAARGVPYRKVKQGGKGNGYRKLAESKSLFSSSQFVTSALYCPPFLKEGLFG